VFGAVCADFDKSYAYVEYKALSILYNVKEIYVWNNFVYYVYIVITDSADSTMK